MSIKPERVERFRGRARLAVQLSGAIDDLRRTKLRRLLHHAYENVPYYRGFGFEVMSDAPLPRDARMWFMQREPSHP